MAYDAGFKQRMFDALLALSRDEQRMMKQADIQRSCYLQNTNHQTLATQHH